MLLNLKACDGDLLLITEAFSAHALTTWNIISVMTTLGGIGMQGSRLRLKRSHLRPKILICEWCFCWGRHWQLYKFTCYDLKICMQLFCDHIFCYVPILNLKLKDDAHQSFSGKKSFKQSSSLPHSSADAHSLLNAAQLCSAREIEMTEMCRWKCRKAVSISCKTSTNYNPKSEKVGTVWKMQIKKRK